MLELRHRRQDFHAMGRGGEMIDDYGARGKKVRKLLVRLVFRWVGMDD